MTTQDEVLGYFGILSNWGRCGDDDELGTLNHIDDIRLAAARAVRHGRSVCGWEVAVPEVDRATTNCPRFADMPGPQRVDIAWISRRNVAEPGGGRRLRRSWGDAEILPGRRTEGVVMVHPVDSDPVRQSITYVNRDDEGVIAGHERLVESGPFGGLLCDR
jgi:hypothetical protein